VVELLRRLPPAAEPEAGSWPDRAGDPPDRGSGGPAALPPSSEPLRVVAVTPTGETELAPDVTVVFSRPMVALGTDGEPIAGTPPARLEPQPPGAWRWLDVRTLRFEPAAGRMPGATAFTVRVLGDVRSRDGERLEAQVEHGFRTAGVRALGGYPNDILTDLDPTILLTFDQRVDPEAVLASARVEAGAATHELRVIPLSDLQAIDTALAETARQAPEGTWVAFRPLAPLPAGVEATLRLGPDLTSLEGPLPAGRAQEMRFRVRGDLELLSVPCQDPANPCRPHGRLRLEFSNPLDPAQDIEDLVRVEPAIGDPGLAVRGGILWVTGEFQPRTSYHVQIDARVRDMFGLRLGDVQERDVHFGTPYPFVRIPGDGFAHLDPTGEGRIDLSVRSVGAVSAHVYRVGPEDWRAVHDSLSLAARRRQPWRPAREPLRRRTLEAGDAAHGFARLPLDLSDEIEMGADQLLVIVEGLPPAGEEDLWPWPYRPPWAAAWIQATSYGVGATWNAGELVVWAASLVDGTPLPGVEIELPSAGVRAVTDARGLAELPLGQRTADPSAARSPLLSGDDLLLARHQGESALVPASVAGIRQGLWTGDPRFPAPVWHLMTDRQLYRPGEELVVHGWLRDLAGEPRRDLAFPERVDSLRYVVSPARGGAVAEGTLPVSASGTFHLRVPLPEDVRSGRGQVALTAASDGETTPDWRGYAWFQVEDFRRPDYEVLAEVDPGPNLPGDTVLARVEARTYDGGPLPHAGVSWRASARTTTWAAPGWMGWRFGPGGRRPGPARRPSELTHETRTDALGDHRLLVLPERLEDPYPASVTLRVQVEDVNRQAGSASTWTMVHPAALAAGVRTDHVWIRAGETVAFDVAAVDLEGTARADAVPDVRVARLGEAWWFPASAPAAEPEPVAVGCARADRVETIGGVAFRPLRCRFVATRSGRYGIDADVVDAQGRRSRTSVDVVALGRSAGYYVQGAGGGEPTAELRPDRASYEPGDTARVLLETPWPSARGLLTVVRYGIREVRPLRLDGPSEELRIPIAPDDVGGIDLIATITPGAGARDELQARARLNVDDAPRRLTVEVAPRTPRVDAGAELDVDLRVARADGAPAAGAEVTLWLVDEAVLGLAGYELGDPLPGFLRPDAAGGANVYLPHRVVLWERRSLGPGIVTAELLDGAWGSPTSSVEVRLEGTDLGTWVRDGRLVLRDVPAGAYRLVVSRGEQPLLVREVVVPAEGLDLGTLLVGADQEPGPEAPPRMLSASALSLNAVVVSGTEFEEATPRTRSEVAAVLLRSAAPPEPAVALREVFDALAAFEPSVRLDAEGRASVPVRLPETVTRYRILAVAADGPRRFGTAESSVTAARDLVVRASPPRTLHPGDRPELPVVVQNVTEGALDVDVVARTNGGLPLVDASGFRVRLDPGVRAELRFPARADRIGAPTFDVLAVAVPAIGAAARTPAGELTDAVRVAVPVRPLRAPRAAAVYRRLTPDEPVRLVVETPERAEPRYGALDVTLSTNLLTPLVDVLRGLCLEPLLWPEPTIARVLGLSALDDQLDVLTAPDLPRPERIREQVGRDVARILEWLEPYRFGVRPGYWPRGADVPLYPLARVHAVHALHEAARAGYDVPEHVLAGYATELERIWRAERARLAGEGAKSGWAYAVAAYALDVATRVGARLQAEEVTAWLGELEPQDLPVEVLAWSLAPAAATPEHAERYQALRTELENRALTTAATVTFRQGARASDVSADGTLERLVLASSRRSDAAALAALIEVEPEHRLIDGLGRGLLGHRDGTTAAGAHENGWVLVALGRYAAATSWGEGDLTARLRVDGVTLSDERFAGPLPRTVHVTREPPVPGEAATIEITGSGVGMLQVRAALRYAPLATLDLPPDERGFLVSRRYEAVDDEGDVRRAADGTWRIRAGARVRVRVTFTAPARRFQVQLADPLPGGLEPLNAALDGTGFADDPGPRAAVSMPRSQVSAPLADAWPPDLYTWDWTDVSFRLRALWRGWATHQELRDDRVEAYTPYLAAGTYETTYLTRATTPGTFLAPPVRVEESEHPETFGQGVVERVVIELRPD
jgi:hypothetical protein